MKALALLFLLGCDPRPECVVPSTPRTCDCGASFCTVCMSEGLGEVVEGVGHVEWVECSDGGTR